MLTKRFRHIKYNLALAIGMLLSTGVFAQQEQEEEKNPAVRVIARAFSDSIVVRWGVDDPVAWQLTNKYGYYIERYTLMQNGKMMDSPERIELLNEPQKPWGLDHQYEDQLREREGNEDENGLNYSKFRT